MKLPVASNDNQPRRRLIDYNDLVTGKGIKYSRQHLRRLESAHQFPKRVKVGGGHRVAWREYEIDAYIDGLQSAA
jgi:predicted DNA-binding transcriptional regulator AlpA